MRPIAIRKRYGRAPPPAPAPSLAAAASSTITTEKRRPIYRNISPPAESLPISIRTGETVGKMTNIRRAYKTRNKSNIQEVIKTRLDTVKFLLNNALQDVNIFNEKYHLTKLQNLTLDDFLPVIGVYQDKYNDVMGELEDFERNNMPLLQQALRAAQQSPRLLPRYEHFVREYNEFVGPRNQYGLDLEVLNERLDNLYKDIPKLMYNLNSIRRLEQNIAAPAAAAAAGTGLVPVPSLATTVPGSLPPSPSNSLFFGNLEGGSRKRSMRRGKTRRSK